MVITGVLVFLIIFIIITSAIELVKEEEKRIEKFNWYDDKLRILTNKKGIVHRALMKGYKENYC